MQPYHIKKSKELAGHFLRRLNRDLYCGSAPMKAEYALSPSTNFADCKTLDYQLITPGTVWGRLWQTGWFRFSGKFVPAPEPGCEPLIRLSTGSELLLYSPQGKALTGLTAFCWFEDDFIRDIYHPEETAAAPGEEFVLFGAVTANALAGVKVDLDPTADLEKNGEFEAVFKTAETLWMRKEVKELMQDMECLISLASTWQDDDYRKRRLCKVWDEAENAYADNPVNAAAARACLAPVLSTPAYADALSVTAVGHSHLDTAYMWTVKEGIQKCGRTFSTQLELIDHDPEYIFGASQPQHYAFTKQYFPEIYARIKKAVAEGRWELQGGMWVESDTNIPGGEALVRQFLHGKNYFMDEFGVNVRNLWLPDVFGYSAVMPQIMKLAGCESYVSIKLTWSDCNKFPYKTFRWRGIDGSEVLGHFPPEGFYSSHLKPEHLVRAQNEYSESVETGEFLSLVGLGDGGAGALREDLAAGRRLKNLAGTPKVKFGPAQPLLDRLHKHWDKLPVWDGELYLEFHRGTATSIASCKRGNRKNEELLAAAEFICSTLTGTGEKYPIEKFDYAWKLILLNQFHDIIAGTSLDTTYEQTLKEYAEVENICRENIADAAKILPVNENAVTLFNTLNTVWSGVVELPDAWQGYALTDVDGRSVPMQFFNGSAKAEVILQPLECRVFRKGAALKEDTVELSTSPVLENELIRYTFDTDLQLISAYDKVEAREIMDPARAASMRLYRDYPTTHEAWDVELHYRDRQPEIPRNSAGVVEVRVNGSMKELFAELCVGKSIIRQSVRLASGSRLLTFDTEVEWNETRQMLRAVFPTNIKSDYATYDIQFGAYRRPTHENTSWDLARFEVPLHKYMDLSDNSYGAALLNDCKYGGKVFGDTLELALLRSAKYPALHSENGLQRFSYAFLPHPGNVVEAGVSECAEMFNRAPVILPGVDGSAVAAPVSISSSAVVLSACKRAEKSDDLIVRLVERYGKHSRVSLRWDADRYDGAAECDLMEWNEINEFSQEKLDLQFHPFEIKTIRLKHRG